jgi:hypothetical protein
VAWWGGWSDVLVYNSNKYITHISLSLKTNTVKKTKYPLLAFTTTFKLHNFFSLTLTTTNTVVSEGKMFAEENGLKGDPRLQHISQSIRVVPHFPKNGFLFFIFYFHLFYFKSYHVLFL